MALGGASGEGGDDESREIPVTDMVEQPAKVMRIGSMIKQLLEEVRAAPLDEASRVRLKEIHASSIKELEDGLAPELVEELERLSLPFTDDGDPVRRRAADRAGPAGRLAGGPVPRHPDGAVRPADGGAGAAGADAPRAAAGCRRRRGRSGPGPRAARTSRTCRQIPACLAAPCTLPHCLKGVGGAPTLRPFERAVPPRRRRARPPGGRREFDDRPSPLPLPRSMEVGPGRRPTGSPAPLQ